MPVIWRVDLYNRNRLLVASVDSYTSITLEHIINEAGGYSLPLWFGDPVISNFEDYGIVEFWRRNSDYGLPWYREKACLIYGKRIVTNDDGYEQYTSFGQGLLAMLDRVIDYPAGSSQAKKSGLADVVMCELVRENAGDLATIANGRRTNGVIPALSVASPMGSGVTWEGARAGKPLLEVLQEIADFSGVDFDVEPYTNPVTGAYEFIFRTYIGQRGIDRTNSGIDPATGLNASGKAPIIFSDDLGNMTGIEYGFSHNGEKNRVSVLGPGEGATRQYTIRQSVAFIGDGLDIHEAGRDARNEPEDAARAAIGDAILAQRQAVETFEFDPIQIQGASYGLLLPPAADLGRFYWFGDRVTGQAYGIERNKRITGVRIAIAPSDSGLIESLRFKMSDVPQ